MEKSLAITACNKKTDIIFIKLKKKLLSMFHCVEEKFKHLHAFNATDADTNMSFLNHPNIICTITDC